jgi:hypothetical protein
MNLKKSLRNAAKALPGTRRLARALGIIRDYQTEFLRDCLRTTAKYMDKYGVSDPNGYVVVMDINHRVTTGLMVPLTFALLRRGYAVCSAIEGRMKKSSLSQLNGISAAIKHGNWLVEGETPVNNLVKLWNIDWEKGMVECEGVNYFPFFLERISKLSKKYRSNLDSTSEINLFYSILKQSDAVLVVCERLLELSKLGKPIRVVGMDSHFAPWGVVRRWCDEVGVHHNIHFVALSSGYENYYSNLSSIEATTLAIEDLTANPELRHPFLGGRARFENFIKKDPLQPVDKSAALKWIKVDRSRISVNDALRQKVCDQVAEARAVGRKVFAAFGKVLIDFAAPDDRGYVYENFPAWMNSLVRLAAETDSLLIIKPHPHEIREEIVLDGVQVLRDLLPDELPPNILFLNHNSFNSFEIAEMVDTSFVWNGTICCEFPVLGCPVVPESIWATRDYPLELRTMESEADYRSIFAGLSTIEVPQNVKDRAAAFLHFLKSEEVMIPFRYLRRAGTNKTIGQNWLYHEQLKKLEEFGDPAMERAADRFFPEGRT